VDSAAVEADVALVPLLVHAVPVGLLPRAFLPSPMAWSLQVWAVGVAELLLVPVVLVVLQHPVARLSPVAL